MTDTSSVSGTLNRTRKQSDTPHPHYFNSFQNYCSGPKAKRESSPTNTDFLPIPERFKVQSDGILHFINSVLIERIVPLTQFTSVLPHEFFNQNSSIDIQKYLIDRTMFKTMNDAGVINWMLSLKKLYPVRTSGNGNCLLHAVLIAMVGVHDFDLHLRDRLRQFMDKNKELLKGYWKTERLKSDKLYGIQSEESKLDSEWEELRDLVRYDNSDDGQTTSNLQFLEAVHIFSLSNMLARPIIILSEDVVRNKHGEAISYNDLFGIYLPILSRPKDCILTPIVLAYDQSHFCPLQPNDIDTKTSADNYLPLYQSVEHTRDQILLPIRFLGNDTNAEQTNKLLHDYLRIKKLTFYPNANPPGLPIVCAELGTKYPQDNNSFFLMYYNYIADFFETQKKKLQEEEEEKRRREQDYYYPNQSPHETTQRSLIKIDLSSSSSPPPPYDSVVGRSSDNRSAKLNERRPSYGEAVENGSAYTSSNDINRLPVTQFSRVQITQKPQINQRTPYINDSQSQQSLSNWDPINDELMSNGKIVTTSRGNDSRLKQEPQNSVRIPVRLVKVDSPSNLIDFDQQTDKVRPCIVCKRYFYDSSSTGLCSQCDYKTVPPYRRSAVITRSPPINSYGTGYKHSDFISPISSSTLPTSKIRGSLKMTCSNCGYMNMIMNTQDRAVYNCSGCGRALSMPRY